MSSITAKSMELPVEAKKEESKAVTIDSLFDENDNQQWLKWKDKLVNASTDVELVLSNHFENVSFDRFDDHLNRFQEDLLVKDALSKGVDLREYSQQIEKDLNTLELYHIQDYENQSETLQSLNNQIQACDKVLERMEHLLNSFKSDLGNISGEIQTLQYLSSSLYVKLGNRKTIQSVLDKVLDAINLPESLKKALLETEIDDRYVDHVNTLSRKMNYLKSSTAESLRSAKDIVPEYEKLKAKVGEKIKDFYVEKFKQFKISKANLQTHQGVFLKSKDLFRFLVEFNPELAAEVRNIYVACIEQYFNRHFTNYYVAILKLQASSADKKDLIGTDESSAKKGILGLGKSTPTKSQVYVLGDRIDVLKDVEAPVILPHVAESQNQKFHFEALFKSITKLMLDSSSSEYNFIQSFFTQRQDAIAEMFSMIMESSLKIVYNYSKSYIDSTYDVLGLLLCIKINNNHIKVMQSRRIPILDNFLNQLQMMLWPKFQAVIDAHISSIKKIGVKTNNSHDILPHYVTRKFSEFFGSCHIIAESTEDMISSNQYLDKLRTEVEEFLIKFSSSFADRTQQLIFLINNYDLASSIFQELNGGILQKYRDHYDQLQEERIQDLVEEILLPFCGFLLSFVKQMETETDLSSIPQDRFEKIAREFNATWKSSLSNINQKVLQSFSNFKNGSTILQSVLKQLVGYYQRFFAILEKRFGRKSNFAFVEEPVSVSNLILEVKKYKSNF